MKIFDGNKLADEIAAKLKTDVDKLQLDGITPQLTILSVDLDERSQAYIKAKVARASKLGIKTRLFSLSSKTSIDRIKNTLCKIALDDMVHGIIVQLPLPKTFDDQAIIDLIPPQKDVDGLTTYNAEHLAKDDALFTPATPLAVVEILKRNNIDLTGKTIAIIGQGKLVGRPLAQILSYHNAEILLADKSTVDLASVTQKADLVIGAAGQPKLIKAEMINDNAVVIDVGISKIDGEIVGDVDFDKVAKKARFITPAVGGVGPMTVVMLMGNVIKAAKKNSNES